VTITASYTFGLVTKEAQKQVTIVEVGTDDGDGDGLPDWWESAHGLDPTSASGINGRNGDFDGDGWTNIEEYVGSTNPANNTSPAPTPPEVKQVNPHNKAGIDDSTRVPADFSFAIRMQDSDGIDITDGSSIKFTINDGINPAYERNLSETEVVRVIKLGSDPDSQATKLWAVYDRSLDHIQRANLDGTQPEVIVTASISSRRSVSATDRATVSPTSWISVSSSTVARVSPSIEPTASASTRATWAPT